MQKNDDCEAICMGQLRSFSPAKGPSKGIREWCKQDLCMARIAEETRRKFAWTLTGLRPKDYDDDMAGSIQDRSLFLLLTYVNAALTVASVAVVDAAAGAVLSCLLYMHMLLSCLLLVLLLLLLLLLLSFCRTWRWPWTGSVMLLRRQGRRPSSWKGNALPSRRSLKTFALFWKR